MKKLDMHEFVVMKNSIVPNEEYEQIIQKYHMDIADEKLTKEKHRLIMGSAKNLVELVVWYGGTPEEVKTAIINTMVCMDAKKYNLDWAKWKRDNHIDSLVQKYRKLEENSKEK